MSTTVTVSTLPRCDFADEGGCSTQPPAARYDFRTAFGPWANGCERHWRQYRATPQLGTGHGQRYHLTTEEATR